MITRMKLRQQDGKTLIAALLVALVLGGIASSLTSSVTSSNRQIVGTRNQLMSFNLAEAGLNRALADLRVNGDGNFGDEEDPVPLGAGSYWVVTTDNEDSTYTITSIGSAQGQSKALQTVVRRSGGLFANAVFAGNSSGDDAYTLRFGGFDDQADSVKGDVYSGGDVEFNGDSELDGIARATGEITGAHGEVDPGQPIPDIQGMNYETNHDIDVADEFSRYSSYGSDDTGGSAWQVPASHASHIFRMNPSDRRWEYESTTKEDYFLEDPYASSSHAGLGISVSSHADESLYFIDGNLWIHNYHAYSLVFQDADYDGTKITFVVKGNIYISDNILYEDRQDDGIVLIAMCDEDVADSGNIYFGDPEFGTLERMEAYMYAENNFFDNNLSASGSAEMDLLGTMSAGNHVSIERDYGSQHSRLSITLDRRLADGDIELPGIPDQQNENQYDVVAWRQVSVYGDYTNTVYEEPDDNPGIGDDDGTPGGDDGGGQDDGGVDGGGGVDDGQGDDGGDDGGGGRGGGGGGRGGGGGGGGGRGGGEGAGRRG